MSDIHEGERIFRICNACRYCEGYCAVFPAMEQSKAFGRSELHYLANLCHNCGECYDACQYAPPHEFGVDVPKLLAELRIQSYGRYAGNRAAWWILAACVCGALLFAPRHAPPANFYAAIPHEAMVVIFGALGFLPLGILGAGAVRFRREIGGPAFSFRAISRALGDGLTLRYGPSSVRRRLHHLTFYGFLLCFASTTVAAFYHYALGWQAPYTFTSLPVLLGTTGGLALLAGTAGLLWLKRPDAAFIATLFLASLTGLLLLALRATPLMGELLAIHLATVAALFLTMPYGKFVHGIYRLIALAKYAGSRV